MNVCGDVVLAVYGPETSSVDETPTNPTPATVIPPPPATANAADAAVAMSTAGQSATVELNIPEILVHNWPRSRFSSFQFSVIGGNAVASPIVACTTTSAQRRTEMSVSREADFAPDL